jgi:hypothetical protein
MLVQMSRAIESDVITISILYDGSSSIQLTAHPLEADSSQSALSVLLACMVLPFSPMISSTTNSCKADQSDYLQIVLWPPAIKH